MKIDINGKSIATAAAVGTQADAPAIYFIHGAGMDHTVWVMQARYFARHGFRVMALDLPGHGKTDGPALDNVDAMADWLCGIHRCYVSRCVPVSPW